MRKRTATVLVLLLAAGVPASSQAVPRFETYLGYSYVRFRPAGDFPDFNANGGTAQFIYNFNPRVGLVGDVGGYHAGKAGGIAVDSNSANFQAGPRVSISKKKTVSPYVQALVGAIRTSAAPRFADAETGFAMLAGGGLNVNVGRHLSVRPAEVSYFLTRQRNPVFDTRNQNNLRASAGAAFLFGGEKLAPQGKATRMCPDGSPAPCSSMELPLQLHAEHTEICQGETISLTPVTGSNRAGVQYRWSLNGQPVSQDTQLQFGGSGLEPGGYRIAVTASGASYRPASAEAQITVLEYRPPSGAVQANPAEIYEGEQSTLVAAFEGQCGGPIQAPAFSASEGTVRDSQFDSTGVGFDPSVHTEQRKTVKIAATASDDRTSGVATTTVTVIRRASAPYSPGGFFELLVSVRRRP